MHEICTICLHVIRKSPFPKFKLFMKFITIHLLRQCVSNKYSQRFHTFTCSRILSASLILVSDWLKQRISWFLPICSCIIFEGPIFLFIINFPLILIFTLVIKWALHSIILYKNNYTNAAKKKNCLQCQIWMFSRVKL